jgi:hypothetical protein
MQGQAGGRGGREGLHRELRKWALLNDLKIYELTNALLADCLKDEAHVKMLIKRVKL